MKSETPGLEVGRRTLGLLVVVSILVLAALAIACHPRHRHILGVHPNVGAQPIERICIDMQTAETTFSAVRDGLLPVVNDTTSGWDSRETVDFLVASVSCLLVEDRSDYLVEFVVRNAGDYGDCDNDYLCIQWGILALTHGNENDYEKVYINFTSSEVAQAPDAEWRRHVNHEFGHAVGLADPTVVPNAPLDPQGKRCAIALDPDGNGSADIFPPVVSVMHRGYCPQVPNVEWPSTFDFISFDANVRDAE